MHRNSVLSSRARVARRIFLGTSLAATAMLSGCVLTPSGASEERDRLSKAGQPYKEPFEKRSLPELPAEPTWEDLLHRAFMADGGLEAAYFDWQAAFERIDIAAAWPNSRVMVGYSYALGPGGMKTFDRMTFSAGFDGAMNLRFPSKVSREGRMALDAARAAGERFRAAKFDLQRRVLSAYADYCLLTAKVRNRAEQTAIARSAADTAGVRVSPGSSQDDVIRSRASWEESEDSLRTARAELASALAILNGLLSQDPGTPIGVPASGAARPLPLDDAALLAFAVEQNPDLAALSRGVDGRFDALERSKLEWLPDISPTAAFTGGIAQAIGGSVMLPTTVVQIRAGIRESEAMLAASEATLRQSRREKSSQFAGTLLMLRDAEAQAAAFETRIIPLAEQLVASARRRYSSGAASYTELLDAQRAVQDSRLVALQARAQREKRLAELEALMGADVETLAARSAADQTQSPAMQEAANGW